MYMHNENEIFIQNINQKPEGRDHLGDLGVNRRIMLKLSLKGMRERERIGQLNDSQHIRENSFPWSSAVDIAFLGLKAV
jgi:hypothetical protein